MKNKLQNYKYYVDATLGHKINKGDPSFRDKGSGRRSLRNSHF